MGLEKRLDGRVALITGAANGIGKAGAILFARHGAKVAVVDLDSDGGGDTVAEIARSDGQAIFIKADVSSSADVEAAVRRVVERYGKLDVVWANAGVGPFHSAAETSLEEWERIIRINLTGAFLVAKHAIPALVAAGGGSILFTGSVNSFVGDRGAIAYCASKGGVLMLSRALALELAANKVRVNCICPAITDTALQAQWVKAISTGRSYDEVVREEQSASPLSRYADPVEIAQAALFLSSTDASYITGSALMVDGGLTAR